MRKIVVALMLLATTGCTALEELETSILGPIEDAPPRPAATVSATETTNPDPVPPAATALTPTQAIASAAPADWRPIDPANLLLIDLRDANGQPGRRVTIELAPAFAPVHVANIRAFTRAGWWNRSGIYRVQDNYVAQWGNGETGPGMPAGVIPVPPAEYDRDLAGLKPRPLGYRDSYAPAVGHLAGWPVAWNPRTGRVNMVHCYGAVGVGRGEAPDTGSGGELYAVIGHAPRHLDRNIAVVGRVIDGMDALSARPRGTEALGFYKLRKSDIPIARVTLASDMATDRPAYEVLNTDSAAFAAYVSARANRRDSFFVQPAAGVDICNAPVPVRRR